MSLVDAILAGQGEPQVVVEVGGFRVILQAALEGENRALRTSCHQQGAAEVEVNLKKLRIQLQRFLKLGDRFLGPPRAG